MLEVDFPHELEHPWISRAGDRSKSRASEASAGIVQRRGVRDVEDFGAEFEVHAFRDPECFSDHQVCILETGATDRVARTVADHKLGGCGEGRGAEVFGDASAIKLIWIADPAGPLRREAQA